MGAGAAAGAGGAGAGGAGAGGGRAGGGRLPRLLCLHGFQTSARILEAQLGRAGWGRLAECRCLDAPHPSGEAPAEVLRAFPGLGPHREWWNAERLPGGDGYDYRGVDASMAAVVAALRRAASRGEPFDGLLGFSQGAGLAHVAMCLQGAGGQVADLDIPPLRFAVLIGGFSSRHGGHRALLERCRVGAQPPWPGYRSVHIWGQRDPAKIGARRLAQTFPEAQALLLEHPGGHVVPALDAADVLRVERFLSGEPQTARHSPTSSL